jgi:acyl-CoA thioesterase
MVFINGSIASHTVSMPMIFLLCLLLRQVHQTPAVHQIHKEILKEEVAIQIRALARIIRNVKRSERRPIRIRTATKSKRNWIRKRKSSKRKTKRIKRRRRSKKNALNFKYWLSSSLLLYFIVILHSSLLTPHTIYTIDDMLYS